MNLYTVDDRGIRAGMPKTWLDKNGTEYAVHSSRSEDRRNFFFIDVPKLAFPGGPFLEGLKVRTGGEWCADKSAWHTPFLMDAAEKRDYVNRAQIWIRSASQKLILVDQFRGIRLLQYYEDVWKLDKQTPKQVADYILQRGLAAKTVMAVDFALFNLERLREGLGLDLRNETARVEARRQELL